MKNKAEEIVKQIIDKGGLIAKLGEYALKDGYVEGFIEECKKNIHAPGIREFWGEELIKELKHYVNIRMP